MKLMLNNKHFGQGIVIVCLSKQLQLFYLHFISGRHKMCIIAKWLLLLITGSDVLCFPCLLGGLEYSKLLTHYKYRP